MMLLIYLCMSQSFNKISYYNSGTAWKIILLLISIIKNIMTLSVLKPVASLKGGAPCSAVENGLPHTRWQ